MNYDDLISTFGINYFQNTLSTVWIKDKFCMVENIGNDFDEKNRGSFMADVKSSAKLKLPLKLTISTCLYCKQGDLKIRIQQMDYEISAGSFFIAFAGNIFEALEISDDCKIIFLALESEFILKEIRHPRAKNLRHWVDRYNEPTVFKVSEEKMKHYEMLCLSVKFIFKNSSSSIAESILLAFTYLISNILHDWAKLIYGKNQTSHLPNEDYVLVKFQEDIRNFSRKDRSVNFYAKRQNFSTKHFSRLINRASKRKPLDIIREYVILDAKSLIHVGKYSIKQISDILGFQNQSFFTRYFKDAVGVTPTEYARQN